MLERILAAGPAVELNPWTLESAALESVLGWVASGRESVLECGSGLSTLLIARLLRQRRSGQVSALEHDPGIARDVCAAIERERLGAHAEVIEAPLACHPFAEPGCQWYEPSAIKRLPAAVDLLLVDGPPAGEAALARSRYPALPVLADRLVPGAVVLLDDVDREGEQWVLDRWQREYGVRFDFRAGARALGCIFRP